MLATLVLHMLPLQPFGGEGYVQRSRINTPVSDDAAVAKRVPIPASAVAVTTASKSHFGIANRSVGETPVWWKDLHLSTTSHRSRLTAGVIPSEHVNL